MLVCAMSMLHICWGLLLLAHHGALDTAATEILRIMVPAWSIRAVLYLVAGMLPAVCLKWPGTIWGLLSVVPQQILLVLSGMSALVAIAGGQYADGVARTYEFIAMDQLIYVVVAMLHVFESIDRYHDNAPTT